MVPRANKVKFFKLEDQTDGCIYSVLHSDNLFFLTKATPDKYKD